MQFNLRRFLLTGTIFALAAAGAGAGLGAALGELMSVIDGGAIVVAVSAALVALPPGADLLGRPLLLQRNSETPKQWTDLSPWRWAIFNGAALGTGAVTRIGFPIWYVLPLVAVASRSPVITAVSWGAYGLFRASASLVIGGRRIHAGQAPDLIRDLGLPRSRRLAADVVALAAVVVLVIAGVT